MTHSQPRTRWSWAAAGFVVAVVLGLFAPLFWGAPRALAHAAYERSEPAFAAELADSPARIDIWFSQQLFRQEGANMLSLTDEAGRAWPTEELVLDRDDRKHVSAEVAQSLPEGRYFVSWTNLSADDGDADAGRYVFYVGRGATAAEIEEDRSLAAELMIPYPGDETEESVTPDAPPPPRPVAIRDDEVEGGLDGSVIVFAVVSVVAVLGLTLTRLRSGGRT